MVRQTTGPCSKPATVQCSLARPRFSLSCSRPSGTTISSRTALGGSVASPKFWRRLHRAPLWNATWPGPEDTPEVKPYGPSIHSSRQQSRAQQNSFVFGYTLALEYGRHTRSPIHVLPHTARHKHAGCRMAWTPGIEGAAHPTDIPGNCRAFQRIPLSTRAFSTIARPARLGTVEAEVRRISAIAPNLRSNPSSTICGKEKSCCEGSLWIRKINTMQCSRGQGDCIAALPPLCLFGANTPESSARRSRTANPWSCPRIPGCRTSSKSMARA